MAQRVTNVNDYLWAVEIGLRNIFDASLKTHPTLYGAWLSERQAKEWIEDDRVLSGFQTMPQKTEGGTFTVDQPIAGDEKDYTLKTYGLAYVITHEMVRWDQYGKLGKPTRLMARSGVERKNILAYSLLNNATDSAAAAEYLIYNGEELCNSAHALLRGGTGKNAPASNLGLSYIGVQTALTDLALTENEDGLFAVVNGENLIVHPQNLWKAREILRSTARPDQANAGVENSLSGELRPHTAPFLTSTTRWFVTASKSRLRECMAFAIGEDLMFRQDYQPSTWNRTHEMYMSCRVELLTWPGVWGTDGV